MVIPCMRWVWHQQSLRVGSANLKVYQVEELAGLIDGGWGTMINKWKYLKNLQLWHVFMEIWHFKMLWWWGGSVLGIWRWLAVVFWNSLVGWCYEVMNLPVTQCDRDNCIWKVSISSFPFLISVGCALCWFKLAYVMVIGHFHHDVCRLKLR